MTITSKRHPVKFYAFLIFIVLLLAGFGTFLLVITIREIQKEVTEQNVLLLTFIVLALYSIAAAFVYAYYYNSPIITIENNTITFGDEKFYLNNIKRVILTGKMPFEFYMMQKQMEGTALIFNDGTEKFFFDDSFSNSWEIKSFLEQTVINKSDYIPVHIEKPDLQSIGFEESETFKGNQFLSFWGITTWGFLAFFIIKIQPESVGMFFLVLVFTTFWLLFSSWQMHFFCITNDYFIVKNHNFFWLIKGYRIIDIKEIVFEKEFKGPHYLRIITNDFRSIRYPANTLRNKTWLAMKRRLETKGITVRNEYIPEKETSA